jgi:Tfp pilus assembly protein PilV
MQQLKAPRPGWAMLDALIALVLWSTVGIGLMLQTRTLMLEQRSTWWQSQATEWLADALERLQLSQTGSPVQLDWGQNVSASSCSSADCNASDWRNSLLADWQTRLARDMPLAQTWFGVWSTDARLQVVGLRWPDPSASASSIALIGNCPTGWQCLAALAWP